MLEEGQKVETVAAFVESVKAELDHVDDCGADLKSFSKRISQCCEWGKKCADVIANSDARAANLATLSSIGMQKARLLAQEAVPLDIADRGLAMKSAANAATADVVRSVLKQVNDEAATKADRLARGWRKTAVGLENAIESKRVTALGPAALREGASDATLKSIMNAASLSAELKTRGVKFTAEQYRTALKVGDKDRAGAIKDASRVFLMDLLMTTKAKLSPIVNWQSGEIDNMLNEARKLLGEYDQADFANLPPEIPAAAMLLEELKKLYRTICGVNVKLMSSAEFAQRFLGANSRLDTGLDIDGAWPTRWMKPDSAHLLKLPGWASALGRDNSFEGFRNARPSLG